MKLLVGLDISVTSPAVCVVEVTGTTKFHLACFAQRTKDFCAQIPKTEANNTSLTVYPSVPDSKSPDLVRYQHIIKYIMMFLSTFQPQKETTTIAVEGYAFVPAHLAGSSYKLHEITGALKYEILQRWDILTQTIAVGKWKKISCGKGNAKKQDVVAMVKHLLKIDMLDVFQLHPKKNGDIPVPVQDVCDALGIAVSVKNIQENLEPVVKKQKIK